MRVARLGFTPVKGGRHVTHASVQLAATGPVGDRAFCLVDPVDGHCVRTIDEPTLLRASASWDGTELSVTLPSGTVSGSPTPVGDPITVDYWGRGAAVQPLAGPWSAAYSAFLGRDVVLASALPGDVVYGASVSLISSASLVRLAEVVGSPVDGARFRATVELDVDDLPPFVEETWVGRRIRLGTAEVEVRGPIPRCAVVNLDPATGTPDLRALQSLPKARGDREVFFGVDAVVTVPGRVDQASAASICFSSV